MKDVCVYCVYDHVHSIKRLGEAVHLEADALHEHLAKHKHKHDERDLEEITLHITTLKNVAEQIDRETEDLIETQRESAAERKREYCELYSELMALRDEAAERG